MRDIVATVKAKMFLLPNFLKLDLKEGELTMRVEALFQSDEAAADFWDECKPRWIEHVARLRAQSETGVEQ